MPIPVACACGQKFAAQDRLAGKTVKCPKCGQPISIPAAPGAAPAKSTPSTSKQPAATAKPTAAKSAKQPPPNQPVDLFAKSPARPAAQPPVDLFASQGPPDAGVGGILDEIGLERFTSATRCPNCGGDMQAGAVICVRCGFNTQTGKQLRTVSDTDAQQRRDAAYAKQAMRGDKISRQKKGSYSSSGGGADADLSVLEILFCVLCAGIGVIVGLIYLVTGNPKGGKMLAISLGMVVFWNVLRFALIAMNTTQ
jgi:hypothetical protein